MGLRIPPSVCVVHAAEAEGRDMYVCVPHEYAMCVTSLKKIIK